MFILDADQIPQSTDELTRAITSSLKKSIRMSAATQPVKISGTLPNLSSLSIDVSMGEVDTGQPLPNAKPPEKTQPGPGFETFTVTGDPVVLKTFPIRLFLSAKNVVFNYARNQQGQLIASPAEAQDGKLSIHIVQKQLDLALLSVSKSFAGKHGVDILKVETALSSLSPTDMTMLLKITAKKFMTAVVEVSGRLRIDDRMVATATNLKANSSGMVGNIAVTMLRPQLAKLEGQPLPLMAFSLGNLKLSGVAVDTSDGLHFTAAFGSRPS